MFSIGTAEHLQMWCTFNDVGRYMALCNTQVNWQKIAVEMWTWQSVTVPVWSEELKVTVEQQIVGGGTSSKQHLQYTVYVLQIDLSMLPYGKQALQGSLNSHESKFLKYEENILTDFISEQVACEKRMNERLHGYCPWHRKQWCKELVYFDWNSQQLQT